MMSKLLHNDIRGVMQNWFESYLSNRKQYVSIKNCSSSLSNIALGVLQGSVFGAILFLLYINDMYRYSNQMCLFILLTIQQFFHPTVTTRKMQLTLEFQIQFLQKSEQSNSFTLDLMKILLLMTM